MPTFRSLTVFFDPLLTGRQALIAQLQPLLQAGQHAKPVHGRRWRLPVCYEGEAGPDLSDVARAIGASVDEVIALHSRTEVSVYMLGFLPGFPFMGDVAPRLNLPRRTEPRVRVPAGQCRHRRRADRHLPLGEPRWLASARPLPGAVVRRGAR